MSTFAKKVTAAVAGVAVVFSMVAPIAGVSAAYTSVDAANKLATLGVIVDQSANPSAYRLGDTTSREELSKIIANLGGLVVTEGESVFADADFADWSEKYAKALNEAGYAASNEFFNPKNNATKIEALKWVMEARGIATGTGDNWMEARVNGAVEAGIATAFTDYNANASRGQVFIWAANAVDAGEEEVVVEDDLLCSILGTCEAEEETTEEETTTPVVVADGEVEVSLSPLSPTSGMVAGDISRTTFVAIDVTAGDEDVTLKDITLSYIGLSTSGDFSELALYRGNKKVTKGSKSFSSSDKEAELSFENDTVVRAGETVTFYVTGKVTATTKNVAHQIAVTGFDATADVTLGTVKSVVFNVFEADNVAKIKVDETSVDSTIMVGEEVTFADFSIEETGDSEDVEVRSITFTFSGSADMEDDITDLVLMAEGEVIATDLMVDGDDEVVANIEYIVPQDEKIDFELVGMVTGSIADDVQVDVTEVYAVGVDTGIIAESTLDTVAATVMKIEGSEINVSFDRSSLDEAKPGAEDVALGTLNMTTDGDYTIDTIKVKVTSTGTGVLAILKTLELDGSTADATSTGSLTATEVTYTFEDISINDETLALDLVAEIEDNVALNDSSLDINVSITKVTDEENDKVYISNLTSILSATTFTNKKLDIKSASLTFTQSKVSQRNLVLGNGIEVVIYQGKVTAGDATDVVINDLTLTGSIVTSTGAAVSYDLKNIIDTVEINVGGVTDTGDVNAGDVKFSNSDIVVPAGATNVDVVVTATLKDYDGVANDDQFNFELTAVSAEDEDGEDLPSVAGLSSAIANAVVKMTQQGTFSAVVVQNGDYDDQIDLVVLAGESDVALAEIEFRADEEDVDVKDLYLQIAGTFDSTIENARIMAGSTTIADAGTVTLSGSTHTIIHFEDFTVEDTGSEVSTTLVVDLNPISNEGGVVSAKLGSLVTEIKSISVEGVSSNNTITKNKAGSSVTNGTTSSKSVAVVPVIVTPTIVSTLGDNDQYAVVSFDVDFGNNTVDNDAVYLDLVKFETLTGSLATLRNDDGDLIPGSGSGTTFDIDTASGAVLPFAEIQNGDEVEFKVSTDDAELRVLKNGFEFYIDLDNEGDVDTDEVFKSSNDGVMNFGTYNVVN